MLPAGRYLPTPVLAHADINLLGLTFSVHFPSMCCFGCYSLFFSLLCKYTTCVGQVGHINIGAKLYILKAKVIIYGEYCIGHLGRMKGEHLLESIMKCKDVVKLRDEMVEMLNSRVV
jgi:hypothetical protein